MAPIRRYLRITKYSVLECRIYLDNPSLVNTWLLNHRDPILPRVFESIKPLVLPKLQEENERARGKGKKGNRGVKDIIVGDEFEVSIFLTDLSTRHSLLTKQKIFTDPNQKAMASNSEKLTGTSDIPIEVAESIGSPALIPLESEDEDTTILENIPAAPSMDVESEEDDDINEVHPMQSGKSNAGIRRRRVSGELEYTPRSSKRTRTDAKPEVVADDGDKNTDDKKKLSLRTSYDGFSIYGRILCLVIKRCDSGRAKTAPVSSASGQAMMEDWIASTQIGREDDAL